jgi:hypothetical protein
MDINEWTYIDESEIGHSYWYSTIGNYQVEIHEAHGEMDIGIFSKKGNSLLSPPHHVEAPFGSFTDRYEPIVALIHNLIEEYENTNRPTTDKR